MGSLPTHTHFCAGVLMDFHHQERRDTVLHFGSQRFGKMDLKWDFVLIVITTTEEGIEDENKVFLCPIVYGNFIHFNN